MPFGMKNAPATFHRVINGVTAGLDGCDAYIGDVVVCSKQLKSFLGEIKQAHLTVKLNKE